MARIYSWYLKGDTYAYIANPNKNDEAYVGNQLTTGDTEIVSEWASNCTEEQYRRNFEDMKQKSSSYGVKFESVEAYLNVSQGCTNLRGPRGRSLSKIIPGGEVTNDDGTFITYWVTFDDGVQDYFLMPKPKDGVDGKPGATGAKGDSPIAFRTVFAYKSGVDSNGNILTNIEAPVGGKWDVITNAVTYPDGWVGNDANLTPPIWMSTRNFASTEGSTDLKWSKPQQITGENGKPGEDGTNMEFIYIRQNNKPNIPQISENTPNYIPNNWSDSPMGVDEDNTTEWYTTRTFDKNTNTWGAWGTVNIWSKYGTNGQDGDGVQYIFLLNNGALPVNPTPADWETNNDYQDKDSEWMPDGIYQNLKGEEVRQMPEDTEFSGNTPNRWYDNSPSVNIDNQYLWMSQRKYKFNTKNNKKQWEAFSDPSLWSKFGADGAPGTNATSIRRLYALSTSTSNPPALPGNSIYTKEWGTGYPKDYKAGENVVWCTEAEVWAHNYTFVERYTLASITNDKGEVIPPTGANTNNNTIEVAEIPEKKVEGYDYLKLVEGGETIGYYEWKSGWSTPIIISGLKGEDVKPIDYTTYVFGYGWADSTPEKPNGTTPENPGTSYDKNNNLIEWMDYPDVSMGVDNSTRRWYQCIGSVDGRNGAIKEWGNVFPCNGSDGVGNYMEFRFGITKNNQKPNVSVFDSNPELIVDGEKTGWFSTDEYLPDIPANGAMWQIWGLIDGKTGELVAGNKWNGPIKISGEKGESGLQGPAGLRGVSGIPGAKIETMYCLGTMNHPFADLGNSTSNMDIPPYYVSVMSDMHWFTNKEMPYTDVIEVNAEDNLPQDVTSVKYGHVYCVINNVNNKTYHTYYLALNNNNYETNYRNRVTNDTLRLTEKPSFKIDESEIKYIVSDGTFYIWDDTEGKYISAPTHNETEKNTIYIDGTLPGSKIDFSNIQFIIYNSERYSWDLKDSKYSINDGYIVKKENELYYRLLRGPILKDNVYDIYIWTTQGSEVYGKTNNNGYVAYKPSEVNNTNTITITSDNLPSFQISGDTLVRMGGTYYKYDKGEYIKTTNENNKKYIVVSELPSIAPSEAKFIEHYDENRVMGYYQWVNKQYVCVEPNDKNSSTSGNTIPYEEYKDVNYFKLVRNNKVIGYYEWDNSDDGNTGYRLLGVDWGIPFKLQGTNGLRGIAGNRGQVVYPMGTYNPNEVYTTTEAKAPYVYDPGDSLFYVYNIVGEPWVGLLPGYIIYSKSESGEFIKDENGNRVNNGLYKTYVNHPTDATSANTSQTLYITGVTADTYTLSEDEEGKIEDSKYIKVRQDIEHISVGLLGYNENSLLASGATTASTTLHSYSIDVYFKVENDGKTCNLASTYKYSKTGKAFDNQWMTDNDGITPASNYANSEEDGYASAWVRFESFQALFANVGIIANGLIGSSVFNNEFMFSQQGATQNSDGGEDRSTNFQDFLSAFYYDEDGLVEVNSKEGKRFCPKSKVKPGETILRERHWCYANEPEQDGSKTPFIPKDIEEENKYETLFINCYFSEGRINPYATIKDIRTRTTTGKTITEDYLKTIFGLENL